MKIIIDAMGGDNAPREIVRGALKAQTELGVDIVLTGRAEDLLQALKDDGYTDLPRGLEIAHASQVIAMDADPTASVREQADSSLVVGLGLLARGGGDAFVSAGSTGALLAGSTLLVKRIKGIRRAALSPVLPTKKGGALLIDCGANVECTPEYLLQFAYMGSYYVKKVMGRQTPAVGLLNNGAEEHKGDPLHREAYQLLKTAGEAGRINFVGNLEGRDIAFGAADVVVADGFSGNVLLKTMEGVGLFFVDQMKEMFMQSTGSKLAALLMKKHFKSFKKMLDYTEYGGAPLLGISKPVIKAHGSSNARAICSAVRQARDFAQGGITEDIAQNIEFMKTAGEESPS